MTQNLAHWLHAGGRPAGAVGEDPPPLDPADLGTAFGLDASVREAIHAEEARRREAASKPAPIDRDC